MEPGDVVEGVRITLRALRGVIDDPEPVDELDHALQAAGLAMAEGADDELVAATLLHDIGRSPALRRWNDRAKVPGASAPGVEDVLAVVARVAGR